MSYQLRPAAPGEVGFAAYNSQGHPSCHPQPPPMNYYIPEGYTRTHTWVANQPSVMSPPPIAKTPVSEWTSVADSNFDRRTLGAATFASMREKDSMMRICGIKRKWFFIVVAVGLFLLVIEIAVGLGAGLASRPTSYSVADSDSSSSTTTPATTTTSSATSTEVSPTPSFTGTLVLGPVLCPQNNNTVYVSQDTSKPFNVQCGRDYNSDRGARDMTHMRASTMAECINNCGKWSGCVGVGFGSYQGGMECWLKSQLGEPNWSKNWYFAQLQDSFG
ncbi:hypothetical protein F5X99DRAFT_240222 [Biscogniauxia marginata]|nr:hypothetical protein F5X99DRAFT_240222 [Biscogniauxia marginata]